VKKAFLKVKNSEPFTITNMEILREDKEGRKEMGEEDKYSLLANKNKSKQKIFF